MKLFVPEPIERYAAEHTRARSPLLDSLRARTYECMPNAHMVVDRVEGALLAMLVRLVGARRAIEIGTFTGYSALCIAEALPTDGSLLTCDVDPEAVAIARSYFAESPDGAKIEVRLGDALESVRALDAEPVDFAFVDADKARYVAYYEELLQRLRPGGLLVFDNVLWSGEVLSPQSADARGIAALNDLVTGDARVDNVLLTVRDGLMLVHKR
jgi:caffeoyl-CoA O-methyltransferase